MYYTFLLPLKQKETVLFLYSYDLAILLTILLLHQCDFLRQL
jgi:hypothetical protein